LVQVFVPKTLATWQQRAGAGAGHAALAEGFLQSAEAARQLVGGYYGRFLGREPDAAGQAHWLGALRESRLTPAEVAWAFLASDEFYTRE
jgi:hypothetical protein